MECILEVGFWQLTLGLLDKKAMLRMTPRRMNFHHSNHFHNQYHTAMLALLWTQMGDSLARPQGAPVVSVGSQQQLVVGRALLPLMEGAQLALLVLEPHTNHQLQGLVQAGQTNRQQPGLALQTIHPLLGRVRGHRIIRQVSLVSGRQTDLLQPVLELQTNPQLQVLVLQTVLQLQVLEQGHQIIRQVVQVREQQHQIIHLQLELVLRRLEQGQLQMQGQELELQINLLPQGQALLQRLEQDCQMQVREQGHQIIRPLVQERGQHHQIIRL